MIPLADDEPTEIFPVVTLLIILCNVLVFAGWQLRVGLPQSVELAAMVPAEVVSRPVDGLPHLFTAMFMHAGWMHLIGNMWFLWIFGNNVEDAMGHFRFLMFYVLCGALAAAAYVAVSAHSMTPMLGASGAVSGVLGAYLVLHPQASIRTLVPLGFFIRVVQVPAYFFLLFWIALQVFYQAASGLQEEHGGGVAYLAHIGGFVAGLAMIFFFQKGRR